MPGSHDQRSIVHTDAWKAGYGVISHTEETLHRIAILEDRYGKAGKTGDQVDLGNLLYALDRLCSAGMWLVVHETYTRNVYLDGRELRREEFKRKPEGHAGGSLNMVPAYCGYLAANVLSGLTRGWLMGQGHCVSAIDSVNLLVGNMTDAHASRYSVSDEGLTRYVRDFYSYLLGSNGEPDSPLGSHVNAHTAGGIAEGGYLGFAELQYIHMPLPPERLVVFLSDGAFEEQRGSDWAPRWWRAEDSGLVAPIMIANGRRIDQRTTMSQQGGVEWFVDHLRLNGFDPILFDGRDPAAFLWAIVEIEDRLEAIAGAIVSGKEHYPARLPYGIAIAPKGAGFPGEGTNLAHNLPLMTNPYHDEEARRRFNEGARRLWVRPEELSQAVSLFQGHSISGRPLEKDNPFVDRNCSLETTPDLPEQTVDVGRRADPASWTYYSPMRAVDETFAAIVEANSHLRPRVGNPDEMRSNRLIKTLEALHFRVTDPEPGIPESVQGAVITALNEEAVACAALANKGGINLIHTYEAFGTKMTGAIRQEIIFTKNCVEAGRPQRWLSIPVIMTSHTWENGKNEHSHQDPGFAESMMGEAMPYSRVLFPTDANSAAVVIEGVYQTRGQIWTLVIPKNDSIPGLLTIDESRRLLDEGALRLDWASYQPERAGILLAAVGAYQLGEILRAARRLKERDVPHQVVYWLEPGRLFQDVQGTGYGVSDEAFRSFFPSDLEAWLFCTHTRPHLVWGLLGPLAGTRPIGVLGYRNEGGTLDVPGMLMVNQCTWAHCLLEVARLLDMGATELLTEEELGALSGECSPHDTIIPFPYPED